MYKSFFAKKSNISEKARAPFFARAAENYLILTKFTCIYSSHNTHGRLYSDLFSQHGFIGPVAKHYIISQFIYYCFFFCQKMVRSDNIEV